MNLFKYILPPEKSTIAHQYDQLFAFVHICCLILTIAILVTIVYFIIKYRRRSEDDVTPVIKHNSKLEITWSVIPLILVLFIFGWGYQVYMEMVTIPADAYEIHVTAQQWLWRFSYQNGATSTGELHVPADRPVKLIMTSNDVLHSFYVPDFRLKQDVVPGRYTSLWFDAPDTGSVPVFCAEYCGTDHSNMHATVIVQTQEDFDNWLSENAGGAKKPANLTPAEWGKQLAQQNACATCHSTDGTRLTGPTWQGIFGSQVQLSDGSTVTVDEDYIHQSILQPASQVVNGFSPVMPSFQGQLSDDQINAIIAYIKTL